MGAIAVMNPQPVGLMPAREITTALFEDFVQFIDRGEKTTRTYLTNLRQFMAWLRYAAVPQPQRADIIAYREWLNSEHDRIIFAPDTATGWALWLDRNGNPERIQCKPSTIKAYLQSVKQFFSWTAANGYYPNVAANVHGPKVSSDHKKDSLTASEVLAVEKSIAAAADLRQLQAEGANKDRAGKLQRSTEQGKRLYAMYLLAVNAGLRTVEISRANIRDLETKNGSTWLYIWGKGRNEPDQKKPIVPEVKAAIDDYLQSRTDHPTGSSPLFVSTGNRSHGRRIASTTISTMLKRALQDAGYNSDRLTAHSLRHTTAQNAMEQTGGNIYKVQQYLRHSNPATTERYLTNETSKQDADIARQLWQRFHEEPTAPADDLGELLRVAGTLKPEQLATIRALAQTMSR